MDALRLLRKRYPKNQRIHLILDNFSPHRKLKVLRFCRQNNIHMIWTPTNASWLNPIECQFTHVKEFVIRGTNYQNHNELKMSLNKYVRYRNKYTQQKCTIVFDVAVRLGQYFGYTAGTWHEILTWFGYKSKGIFPEFPSAFSWEDIFSNLLGSDIAAEALRDSEHTYDDAVTYILNKKLEELDVQSAEVARYAAEKVRGIWFSGEVPPFVNMKGRNFDIGLDDGFVTPWTVSSICQCQGQKAQPYPVPKLDFLRKYGFSMKFEIAPHVWEGRKILKIVCHDGKSERRRIEPVKDFAPIINEIRQEAQKKGYN